MLTDSVLTEAEMQASILSAARGFNWLAYATYRSTRSEPGFPDLVLVRPPRVIFAELKTATGKVSKSRWSSKGHRYLPGQEDWGRNFTACPGVEYYLVRPDDLQSFMETLR